MLRDTWLLIRGRWLLFFMMAAAVLLVAALALPYDHPIAAHFAAHRTPTLRRFAHFLRDWGQGGDILVFVTSAVLLSRAHRRPSWARGAGATVLAVLCAAALVNSVRVCSGRARPRLNLQDGFRGPSWSYDFQSFPSGHSGSSCAGAAALLVTVPWVGVPAALSAGGVMWASVYQRSHYLTDVIVGGGMGALIGLAFGLSSRRRQELGSSLNIGH